MTLRSVRVTLHAAALLLILLPVAMLLIAYGYERVILSAYEQTLTSVAARVVAQPSEDLRALALKTGVELQRLDARGAVMADSHTGREARAAGGGPGGVPRGPSQRGCRVHAGGAGGGGRGSTGL